MYKRGLFIFRRDLRTDDNSGLIEICKQCETVYCIFIFDPVQIDKKKNEYYSPSAFLFMLDSIKELYYEIPLNLVIGDTYSVVKKLVAKHDIDLIMFNEDYTPYSIQRDVSISTLCKTIKSQDVALNAPYTIKPYKVFTPYYNYAIKTTIVKPCYFDEKNINKLKLFSDGLSADLFHVMIANAEKDVSDSGLDIKQIQRGGRNNGIRIIQSFKFDTYKNRDMLFYESSRVSPHLKFGTLSCREVYHECGVKNGVNAKGSKEANGASGTAKGPKEASGTAKGPSINLFRKQLYWRDFYMQIGYHFPHVFKGNFKNDKIKWSNNKKYFDAWCSGETGFDIVDACMHQLNTTGYMHNRGRMIVSNFLTKLLGVDWRWGEKYFATKLTDYDPCNNNGGWQWSAGTGADAQPYYRIFNPMLQQKKFDPDNEYIAKWLKSDRNIKPIINYEIARTKYLNNIKK